MGDKPFFEFDILAFSERDVETLEAFSKILFDAALVRQRAEDIIYTGKVTSYVNELLRNPSESFTRFLLGEINITTGKLTARRVEKFMPIVKKAIQSTLLDMATRSIKQETDEPVHPAVAAPAPTVSASAAAAPPVETASEPTKGIVTTPEELEAYDIIRRICADSTSAVKTPVQYLDSVNYFGVNIGNRKKWFMRLFFDGRRKAIVTRIPLDRAAPLVPGFEIELAPENIGKSRVFISGLKDLERLRPLVLLAYEEEIKRAEAAGAEDDDAQTGEAVR
jgi:predicted type IV restriction endonuclease